ncbi:unnamed protein product [Enterobius vermicularis]|uniref:Rho-GAP domain-containing protein n=1 Tax=Enterobius vermicularis TaxID=51028 RepID=A0A158Q9V9_ENTVE|nr:unnamed protein product [Enterobius vermicularis]
MDRMVASRPDGIDIAFDRGKAWSKYCKELLNYVSRRMQLELEHAKRIQSLSNQTKLILNEFQNFLPLKDVFDSSFESDVTFCEQTYDAVKHAQDRFIKKIIFVQITYPAVTFRLHLKALEMRRDDHERQRRLLKNEWIRVTKLVKDTQQELVRAKSLLETRVDGYRRAQENFENSKAVGTAVGSELVRRRKEMERRKKNEEEAHNKRIEAEGQVEKLEMELEKRQHQMQDTKVSTYTSQLALIIITLNLKLQRSGVKKLIFQVRIVGQLRELVYRCDQTTKACSTHYFQALSNLWVAQPGKYHEFAEATRSYSPGTEYMSFLQSHLPRRTVSSSSLYRTRPWARNSEIVPILFGYHSSVLIQLSCSAQDKGTHHFQKVRQPTRCVQCDAFSIFSTVQCTQCRLMWHKSCVPRISITCDQSMGASAESPRRMSIFGIPLHIHLDVIKKQCPLILECCIDELQRHGLRVRGIYRTCGVKSKVEQICEEFEKAKSHKDVNLSGYHPMNIASVVKLYLRQLPQPLLTQELYSDWVSFAENNLSEVESCAVEKMKGLLRKLPPCNYTTLKFLLVHLNRVTWFEVDNLMTASNLGAVISPSLIWKHPSTPPSSDSSFFNDAHLMSKAVELLIKLAFEVFELDRIEDWKAFFQKYPELEEPQLVDLESEASITEEGLDDSIDYEDAEGLIFQPQPPTPDLLKNTSRSKKESYSASDDLDSPLGSTGEASGSGSGCAQRFSFSSTVQLRDNVNLPKTKPEKKRSYTTSILVSPRSDRKPQKYNSVDVPKISNHGSNEVDYDALEGQQFFTRNEDSDDCFLNLSDMSMSMNRNFGNICYGSERNSGLKPDLSHEAAFTMSGNKMCLPSAGVLFSGSDVSYV